MRVYIFEGNTGIYKENMQKGITTANRAVTTGTPAIVMNGNLTLGMRDYSYFSDSINQILASTSCC